MDTLRQPTVLMLLVIVVVSTGCGDAKVVVPPAGVDVKYNFHVSKGGPEFGEVVVYLMHDEFRVNDNGIANHRYTGKYNGCVRVNAILDDSEAVLFSFVNWSQVDDQLLIDLNLSPDPNWTMVIGNDNGGRLDAVISGTVSSGEQREYLLTGSSPKMEVADECVQNATTT